MRDILNKTALIKAFNDEAYNLAAIKTDLKDLKTLKSFATLPWLAHSLHHCLTQASGALDKIFKLALAGRDKTKGADLELTMRVPQYVFQAQRYLAEAKMICNENREILNERLKNKVSSFESIFSGLDNLFGSLAFRVE